MNGDRQNEILYLFPFMVLTGVLFAFVTDAVFTGDWRSWTNNTSRRIGFTFTGWLLGVLIFIYIFGRLTSFGWFFLMNMFLPVFAIAQGIGRVGCFLSGCCYGFPCQWGVRYPEGSIAYEKIGDLTVFPVQIVEACLLILLFVVCLHVVFNYRAVVYLLGVGVIRFVLEYFRGDIRGHVLGCDLFSPQQLMSILFVCLGLLMLLIIRLKYVTQFNFVSDEPARLR